MTRAMDRPTRLLPDYYPQFVRVGHPPGADEAWEGLIRPFEGRGPDEIAAVLADLRAGSRVHVQAGTLIHDPECQREHKLPQYVEEKLSGAERDAFRVRIIVWPPPQHPKAVAIYPEISLRRFPHQPHMFQGARALRELPFVPPDALCTYRPGDGEWSWRTPDLVTFAHYVTIYLAKHMVWERTGADATAIWIGPQASHASADLVAQLDPRGECRCGRGTRYADCCRPLDQYRAELEARIRQSYRQYRAQRGIGKSAA
jgi:hypothetical protein